MIAGILIALFLYNQYTELISDVTYEDTKGYKCRLLAAVFSFVLVQGLLMVKLSIHPVNDPCFHLKSVTGTFFSEQHSPDAKLVKPFSYYCFK